MICKIYFRILFGIQYKQVMVSVPDVFQSNIINSFQGKTGALIVLFFFTFPYFRLYMQI